MDEEIVVADDSKPAEDVAPEATAEDVEGLKARLAKAEELATNYKLRAEKAEKKPKEEVHSQDGLSNHDVLALAKADISEEDLDEVIEFAKFKKLSVKDALATQMLKNILDSKAEERRSALATQTKGSPRGSSKVSGEDLLTKAQKTGEVPTSEEGMQELFKARRAGKFK